MKKLLTVKHTNIEVSLGRHESSIIGYPENEMVSKRFCLSILAIGLLSGGYVGTVTGSAGIQGNNDLSSEQNGTSYDVA